MPPKALRRPARAGVVVGIAKAKAKARARGGLRRPAARGEAEALEEDLGQGVENNSVKFNRGEVVEAFKLPLETWQKEEHVEISKGIYWEEEVQLAGHVLGLVTKKDKAVLQLKMEGTQNENLVKWSGANPGKILEVDLCKPGCALMSKEGLVHCRHIRKVTPETKAGWMDNLVVAGGGAAEPEDEMRRLRAREREHTKKTGATAAPAGGERLDCTESGSSESAKRRKRKKKKKGKLKIVGTKGPEALFSSTALDPKPEVRRRIKRKARRMTKRRNRRASSGSSESSSETAGSESSGEEGARLFGEEVRVKKVWKRSPGALTLNTLELMQNAVVTHSGQMWDLDRSALPPIFSQYWKLALQNKMSGPLARESQTLCFLQDLLLQGKAASACDVAMQRLKGLEQIASGGHYTIAQRQELVPAELQQMSTPMETLEAGRLQREEMRAKSMSSRPWERRPDWDKKNEETKGKGKGKDGKGKNKSKSDRQVQGGGQKEEREKK